MTKYIRPVFRAELLSAKALAKLGITLTQLAAETGCTESALRLYRNGATPGGEILGNLVQALRARGVATTAGHAMSIEPAPAVIDSMVIQIKSGQ